MVNRLGSAVSPYLRSHADNPVDWFEWGEEAFAEAERRQVPVFISIGYSTCHWCHVMARESFSDPVLARDLNERFVAIKVDREEHPDVDATYLAAAGAFTEQLGWPLSVFATPGGRAFFAGTYFPPEPVGERASFRQVLDAVTDAWTERHGEVEDTAARLAAALAASSAAIAPSGTGAAAAPALPDDAGFARVVAELASYEDQQYGGFGGAPKFPVATTILLLLDRADLGDAAARALAGRTLDAMAASDLRDAVEGGFFRYATRRDWSEPHYERMLYDNALLLHAYARAGRDEIAAGIAGFLLDVMRVGTGFASAQDSESTVDGLRVEGGYYALDAAGRAAQQAPALDEKVLTGWNGLAIGALASAGARLGRQDWVAAAVEVASGFLSGELVRARTHERSSSAAPTLEDYGMLADGLIDVALATGDPRFAARAQELVERCRDAARENDAVQRATPFRVPGGADGVLVARGLALRADPSEGAYPSGESAIARAATRLSLLGAREGTGRGNEEGTDDSLRTSATTTVGAIASLAAERPISFSSALGVMSLLTTAARQLVVVTDDSASPLLDTVRSWSGAGGIAVAVTSAQAAEWSAAGFELFEGRAARHDQPTAYLCEDFVCALPVTEPAVLAALL